MARLMSNVLVPQQRRHLRAPLPRTPFRVPPGTPCHHCGRGDGSPEHLLLSCDHADYKAARRDLLASLKLPSDLSSVSRLWDIKSHQKEKISTREIQAALVRFVLTSGYWHSLLCGSGKGLPLPTYAWRREISLDCAALEDLLGEPPSRLAKS